MSAAEGRIEITQEMLREAFGQLRQQDIYHGSWADIWDGLVDLAAAAPKTGEGK